MTDVLLLRNSYGINLFPMLFILILSVITSFSFGLENLGVYGKVYPIEEKNILEEIQKKSKRVSFENFEKLLRKSTTMNIDLPVAKRLRINYFSIIYTVPQDVYIEGKLIARKGEEINVLKKIQLHRIYVVLNDYMIPGFTSFAKRYPNTVFLIAKGNVYDLDLRYPNLRIYGALPRIVKALRVKAVPSIVYQHEDKLVVVEVPWAEGKALLPF